VSTTLAGVTATPPTPGQALFLHVGLPKSGTTYLQGLLAEHRDQLRAVGVVYPFVRPEAMFHAAVELREQPEQWGLTPDGVAGSWDALLARVRESRSDGVSTGIISHEILAGALPDVVERVARDTADLDLHVVVTVRDLPRQAAAHWQEQVKNGRDWTFATFERELFEESESAATEDGFWRMQDLEGVLGRWGAVVPADHVHVVTVPPPAAAPDELWLRFCDAVGLAPATVDVRAATTGNESLGVAQVQLLRQVVEALDGRLPQPHYAHVVKRWFAQRLLSGIDGARAVSPRDLCERLAPASAAAVDHVRHAGYAVHGDLEDLLPPLPGADVPHPDDVSADAVLEGLPGVVAEVLLEVARLRSAEPPDATDPASQAPGTVRRWGLRRTPRA
jgi:hypothetical protein